MMGLSQAWRKYDCIMLKWKLLIFAQQIQDGKFTAILRSAPASCDKTMDIVSNLLENNEYVLTPLQNWTDAFLEKK